MKSKLARTRSLGVAVALVAAPILASGDRAQAGATSYATYSDFLAATSGDTTLTFNAAGDHISYGTNYIVSQSGTTVDFNQPSGRLFTVAPSIVGTAGVTVDYLNNNDGLGGMTITFSTPIYGFAADIGTLANWGGASALTETFTFGPGYSESVTFSNILAYSSNPLIFAGYISDTPVYVHSH